MKEHKTPVTVLLKSETMQELDDESNKKRVSVSAAAREIIENHYAKEVQPIC